MLRRRSQIIAILTMFAVVFTCLPMATGDFAVHAASAKAPAQVKGLKGYATGQTSIRISWTKIKKNKNTKGYAIYRNGAFIKRVGKGTSAFTNTGLKAGTSYRYQVRAYNTYKQKQWYNKKTKKWQTKKPAKKIRGKSRNVTKYKYGKYSAAKMIATKTAGISSGSGKSTGSSSDSAFANSILANKTVDIRDGGQVISYKVNTSGSVKWNISGDACMIDSKTSNSVNLYCYMVGTATLKATNHDGQVKTCTITVKKSAAPATNENVTGRFEVTSVKPSKIHKCQNASVSVSFPVTGCKVSWASSDASKVSVSPNSNGSKVTLKAGDVYGDAKITGTLSNYGTYAGVKTVSFTVTNTILPQEDDGSYSIAAYNEPSAYTSPIIVKGYVSPINYLYLLPSGSTIRINMDTFKWNGEEYATF